MGKPDLAVVLPCAGAGSRLGLTQPKPLFEVLPGLRLIDLSLIHVERAVVEGLTVRIVVVVTPLTQSVFEYVSDRFPQLDCRCAQFDSRFREWPGSVYSAREHYAEYNQVLLSDSQVTITRESPLWDSAGRGLLGGMHAGLRKRATHFQVVEERSERLSSLGALAFSGGEVTRLSDKPTDWTAFNGFWSSFGFHRGMAGLLCDHLLALVEKRSPGVGLEPLGPPGASRVHQHQDLGTWASIDAFRARYRDRASFLREWGAVEGR